MESSSEIQSALVLDDIEALKNPEKAAVEFIEYLTKNAGSVQERVLNEILSINSETEYLCRFNLNGATDCHHFKSKIPVIHYKDIKPDIQRIVNGDMSPILCAERVTEFFVSSGTSNGEFKLIPVTEKEWENYRFLHYGLLFSGVLKHWPDLGKGKGLYFFFMKSQTRTPGGLMAGTLSTSYYKRYDFKNYVVPGLTSPYEAIVCPDTFQSTYIHFLCGLIMREQVLQIGSSASGLVSCFHFFQENWKLLVNDISTGTLNPRITDPSIRECMAKILSPNPQLAKFITTVCSQENWQGIIKRIWPNTRFISSIVTGSMAQYIPTIDYFSDGLPFVCPVYSSSECQFGLNLNARDKPSDISYTIMPNVAYFEFIPTSESDSSMTVVDDSWQQNLVDLVDVEVDKEYEIVITTYNGLYRYRVGDILKVTGFYNSTPQFKFIKRKNVLLSIDFQKTDEVDLQKAVLSASSLLYEFNTTVVDYTSHADTKTSPGHYVMYLELLIKDPRNSPSDQVLNKCCLAMEEALDSKYRQMRVVGGTIGPLEIRVVKNGTFQKLMDFVVSQGSTSIMQYKVPRCVHNAPILGLLESRVISKHFSPSPPHNTSVISAYSSVSDCF